MPAKRKQLIVLLIVAVWISLTLVYIFFISRAGLSAIEVGEIETDDAPWAFESILGQLTDSVLMFIASSVPAAMFGGILFWWFEKDSSVLSSKQQKWRDVKRREFGDPPDAARVNDTETGVHEI